MFSSSLHAELYCVPGTNASTVKVEPTHRSWVQDLASLWYKIMHTEPFASPRVGDWLAVHWAKVIAFHNLASWELGTGKGGHYC